MLALGNALGIGVHTTPVPSGAALILRIAL